MDWLFERTIELAAWVAFVLGAIFLFDSVYMLYLWTQTLSPEEGANAVEATNYLANSGQAAAKFVGAAIGMGILACIDHYVFDLPDQA
ncbi:MAG: hypothetical protein AAGD11_11400 [Planctomycetota bacterium]